MTDSLQARDISDPGGVGRAFARPSLLRLMRAHKAASATAVGVLLVLVAIGVVSAMGARVSRIGDSTPCSVWGAAPQRQRDVYAGRYVREHGPLPSGASDAPTIEGVIDNGCTYAYGFDEADTITVLQSIRREY